MEPIPNDQPPIPQPIPPDNERYAEEKEYRASQLRISKILNGITVVGVIATLGTIWLLYSSNIQSRKSFETGERAYLAIGTPHFDWEDQGIKLPFLNHGHIPSGPVHVEIHEATYIGVPHAPIEFGRTVEKHWGYSDFYTVDPTSMDAVFALFVHAPQMTQAAMNAGYQRVIFVATITYNDGFPKTPQRDFQACFVTFNLAATLAQSIKPCDATKYLPLLKKQEGYPNNKQQDEP